MTNTNLLQAMGRIDPKLIAEAAPDIPQKKTVNKTWLKWASAVAACFCFVVMIGVIGRQSSIISSSAVINYGSFIFVPVLIVSFIPLCVSFVKKETTLRSLLITSAISLVAVNILNILGVYLYSQIGGINIIANLPIILITSNLGSLVSLGAFIPLALKIKSWWIKLLLWLFISVVSIILACVMHNIVLPLFQGNMITIA
ncbi:MAG: hypothetical protein IJX55_05455 [Clostridia bacterium]|nr:hypothetical protein [Clostridia bacterium]